MDPVLVLNPQRVTTLKAADFVLTGVGLRGGRLGGGLDTAEVWGDGSRVKAGVG